MTLNSDVISAIAGSDDDINDDDYYDIDWRRCYDRVFAVNYLGHFLLVHRLLPLLVTSVPSRIVSVSSIAHTFIHRSPLDLNNNNNYYYSKKKSTSSNGEDWSTLCSRLIGYDASKLALVLHARQLAKLLAGQ